MEPEGMLKGSNKKVRITSAITAAKTIARTSSTKSSFSFTAFFFSARIASSSASLMLVYMFLSSVIIGLPCAYSCCFCDCGNYHESQRHGRLVRQAEMYNWSHTLWCHTGQTVFRPALQG